MPESEGLFGYDIEHKLSLQFRIVNDEEGLYLLLKKITLIDEIKR